MSGCIVQVWWRPEARVDHPGAQFAMIETEFADFAEFCGFAEADRLIGGAVLWTRRDGAEQLITRRQPIALRGSAILRCQLPNWRFVEET